MAHPVCWPATAGFDPLGSEAATSLTQDLSPEQSADILLLGCGNPQHILFTLSTDVTCPPNPRKIDITCCDLESAVLAREILLFTLIEDDVPLNHIWDIFYHFKLTEHAFNVLSTHAHKLADLAASTEKWRQSKYGSFIKMADAASLVELRRSWTSYAEFPNLPSDRLDKLRKELEAMSIRVSAEAKEGIAFDLSRSAAGMWRDAAKPVNDQFGHYWQHGTTATANKDIKRATKINPTFCYSELGETFEISDHTFPQGYHLVSAFTPLVFDPAGPETNSAMAKAKQQFRAGCVAFQASRKVNSIVLRYFVGDAILFCRALGLYNRTNDPKTEEFASHWRATPIDLTESITSSPAAPRCFDVIECSSLPSRVGLFNLLLAGQPLLKKNPASQAILYTEMTLHKEHAIQVLWRRLWTNVPAAGILLGLVPRPYVSLFTSTSNAHMHTTSSEVPIFTERIAWVDPAGGDKYTHSEPEPSIAFRANDLGNILFDVYHEMVHYDSRSSDIQRLSPEELKITSDPQFTRETFAIFVAHVKSRVQLFDGTWFKVMELLTGLIAYHGTEKSLLNHFYDLQHQLRLHGVSPLDETGAFEQRARSTGMFRDWPKVPRLVCIVLTVPHDKLSPLRNNKLEPTPRLVCEYGVNYEEVDLTHSSIQAAWGKCIPLEGCDGKYVIEEDSDGFRGTSDLVVSFWTDAEMIIPPGMQIWLRLRSTPHAFTNYKSVLGPQLKLFTARLLDKEHVLILRERPLGMSQTQRATRHLSLPLPPTGTQFCVKAQPKNLKDNIDSITARVDVKSGSEKAQLARVNKGVATQIGPCTLELTFGEARRVLRFPYLIRGSGCKVVLDKTAHVIDVTAPIAKPIETGGYPFSPFPVVQHTNFSPWSVHHVHVDRMPKVAIHRHDKIRSWIVNHTALQMSDRERIIQRSTHASTRRASEALANFKESMAGIVLDYIGVRDSTQGRHSAFGLIEPTYGIHTIVMVAGLRLDLAGASFVLDCAVVCISSESAPHIAPGIGPIEEHLLQVRTRPIEVPLWKNLLPAFVERGRTWSHKSDCRYKSLGSIPLSDSIDADPLCKCGHGIGLDTPEWDVPAWKALLPHATRAVLSPLFGVSYLETVGGPASRMRDFQKPISWGQPTDVCWQCNDIGRPLLVCTGCKKARYCSKECQREHWKAEHKRLCSQT